MIGGEGEENPIWMTHGTWIEYAEKFVKQYTNLSFNVLVILIFSFSRMLYV